MSLTLPALPYPDWEQGKITLHLMTQIVGKVRMALEPKRNHWWHVTLYVDARGLTTGAMPLDDGRTLRLDFDFVDHALIARCSDGREERVALAGQSIASFYADVMAALKALGVSVSILARPYDQPFDTPFAEDTDHAHYDGEAVARYWRALQFADRVFKRFAGRFNGKQTPVHLFWHSFDLALTRFSGKAAPLEGGTRADREAYSHEVISFGFWPGDPTTPMPGFYAYAYPEPAGLNRQPLAPDAATWVEQRGSALAFLPYDAVRAADDPEAALTRFLDSAYRGAATLAGWNMAAFERADG